MIGSLGVLNPCGENVFIKCKWHLHLQSPINIYFANAGFDNYAWSTDKKSKRIGKSSHGLWTVLTSFNKNNSVINEANVGNVLATLKTIKNWSLFTVYFSITTCLWVVLLTWKKPRALEKLSFKETKLDDNGNGGAAPTPLVSVKSVYKLK